MLAEINPQTQPEKGKISMNLFEFRFRWGGRRSAFGIDVNARSMEEAITKAGQFFSSDYIRLHSQGCSAVINM